MVLDESGLGERLEKVLEPFAATFSGSLGRGDLVIPQAEIDRLVQAILAAVRTAVREEDEVSEHELFAALAGVRRLRSVQDQATHLRARFRIRSRS